MLAFLGKLIGGPIIGTAIKTVGGIFEKWQERKLKKAEGKIRIEEARIDKEVRKLQGDIDYNVEAQKGMQASWKDEFLIIVLWGFFVMCFVPPLQVYIQGGLIFLKAEAPWWLEYSLVGSVVASFGLKGWKFWELRRQVMNGSNTH